MISKIILPQHFFVSLQEEETPLSAGLLSLHVHGTVRFSFQLSTAVLNLSQLFLKLRSHVRVKIGAPNRPQWPSPPWPPIWTIPRRRTCFHTCISGTSLQRHNSNGYQEISEISHQKVSPKLGNDGVDASGSRAQLLALEPLVSKID